MLLVSQSWRNQEEKAAEQAQFVNTSDASLITALQRLYYGTTIPIERQQYQLAYVQQCVLQQQTESTTRRHSG